MLDLLMFATHTGPWGPGPIPEPPAWWEGLLDNLQITDIAIVFFTGLLVLSNIGFWLSTRFTTRMGQRAYLSVEPHGIVTLADQGKTLAHIGVRNTGHLPARDVYWTFQIEAPQLGNKRDFPITGESSGSYIVPNGTVMTFGTPARIPASSIIKTSGEAKFCYVWGEVRYNDGFNETHCTKFCHRYPINVYSPDGSIDRKYARYHDYGNEAD